MMKQGMGKQFSSSLLEITVTIPRSSEVLKGVRNESYCFLTTKSDHIRLVDPSLDMLKGKRGKIPKADEVK